MSGAKIISRNPALIPPRGETSLEQLVEVDGSRDPERHAVSLQFVSPPPFVRTRWLISTFTPPAGQSRSSAACWSKVNDSVSAAASVFAVIA